MAFGFHPNHKETFTYANLTQEQFLALSVYTAQALNWNVSYVHDKGFSAQTLTASNEIGEDISLQIEDHQVTLISESHHAKERQEEQNKTNLRIFLAQLYTLQQSATPEMLEELSGGLRSIREVRKEALQSKRGDFHDPGERFDSVWAFAVPAKGYFATPLLIYANLLVFVLMVISGVHFFDPSSEDLIAWGGNFRPYTLQGEPWRLFTACFLHGGVLHLAMNMYALWYIGVLLEPLLGTTKFTLAYLLAGIGASAASLYWHEYTVCVGASGAIFGMYGVFIAMLTTNLLDKEFRNFMMSSMGIYVAYNLFYGLTNKGIDNAAHIGGLLAGALIGYALYFSLKKGAFEKFSKPAEALVVFLILAGTTLVYFNLDNSIYDYEQKMKAFGVLEKKALDALNGNSVTRNTTEITGDIYKIGLPAWKETKKILIEIDSMDLPELYKERNVDLHRYVDLRIKTYELIAKAYSDTDEYGAVKDVYDVDIKAYDKEIEKILEKLNAGFEGEE